MPRNAVTAIENNFTGGFVTQATGLNFPPHSCFDQDNIVISEVGYASRRLGMDFENNFSTLTSDRTEMAQSTFLWKNAAGDGNVNLVVQQNGATLFFYNTSSEGSLSSGVSANTVLLSSFQSSGSTAANLQQNECQYSTGLGYLFVVHPYCDPFYILYNPGDGSFTASRITFTIRDLNGLTEAGQINARPTSLSDNHQYNILNQGWNAAQISTFHTAASAYPSNADVWWNFNDSTDIFNPSATLASVDSGSSPAPQGFFRLNPWNTARAATALAQSGVSLTLTGTPDQTSGTIRPSVTEFFSGRVFYSGVNAQGYNSLIYFSTIIQTPTDFGQCCSTQDPTSQTLFDFLPSDGGVIAVPQAGTIYRLVSIGTALLVFGANGVWSISGSTGIGFEATDYQVSLVGLTRSISGTSFVQVDGAVAWWNTTAINIIQSDPTQGLTIKSMTDDKIKDYYLSLSTTNKRFSRGAYNPREHTIRWLFKSSDTADITDTYTFDTVLSFNTLVGAWYTWTLPTDTVTVNSIVVEEGSASLIGSNQIVDNSSNNIVDNSGDLLITYGFAASTITTVTKFLVSYPNSGSYNFTFAEQFNTSYFDWTQYNQIGEDYVSYFITGYNVPTQGERNFQSNYLFVFSDVSDEDTSYYFQAIWNYANSNASGKWSQRQTLTNAVGNYDVVRNRLKVRGMGNSAQFKFNSISGKPFNLIGWSTYDTANAAP